MASMRFAPNLSPLLLLFWLLDCVFETRTQTTVLEILVSCCASTSASAFQSSAETGRSRGLYRGLSTGDFNPMPVVSPPSATSDCPKRVYRSRRLRAAWRFIVRRTQYTACTPQAYDPDEGPW
ncbi:hypothetical protein B0H15DRAFT_151655 [Mycena belliarum]|uniref:Secreted protein n=1 Tax=Mycena belliarum TaxID=1033014 RepID=A0AAD6U7N4_9AGAR|nr:hypothetical protein B0H15DRAFT_151655 [Mycena belliae]